MFHSRNNKRKVHSKTSHCNRARISRKKFISITISISVGPEEHFFAQGFCPEERKVISRTNLTFVATYHVCFKHIKPVIFKNNTEGKGIKDRKTIYCI